MLFLLQICFWFVMRDNLCCLFLTIIRLIPTVDDTLNIDNDPYFKQIVCKIIYPADLS